MIRLPRFKRSPDILAFKLTRRDREILRHVHRHRFMRSDHVAALTPGSRQQVLRRLQRLFHHGYLERPQCQIDYYKSGSRRMAYGLGNKGAAWLKRELALPYQKLDWNWKNRVTRLFLEHALLVSDLMVAIELTCRQQPGTRLLTPDGLDLPRKRELFQWTVDIGHHLKCGVIPDRVFGLEFSGKRCWYFLEADRGTMPVERRSPEQTSFARKLLAYHATWQQKVLADFVPRFRVLTVTTTAERMEHLIEASRALTQGKGSGLFLFTHKAAFDLQTNLFELLVLNGRGESTRLIG